MSKGVHVLPPSPVQYPKIHKFGFNPDIGTGSDPEDIWDQGGLYTFMSAVSTMYVSSDAEADQGISVAVEGLDGSWRFQSETIATDGTDGRTFVALANTYLRINRAYIDHTASPAGNIYISDDNTDAGGDGIPDTVSNIKAQITIGYDQTLQAVYTVPVDNDMLLSQWYATVGRAAAAGDRDVRLALMVRENAKTFRAQEVVALDVASPWRRKYDIAKRIPAKADVLIRAVEVLSNNTAVAAGFDGRLVQAG
jgi:hypothetical protein